MNCYNAGLFAHGVVPMHAFNSVFGASFYLAAAFGGVAQDDNRIRRFAFEFSANRLFCFIIGAAGIEHRNRAAIFDLNVLPTKNLEDNLAGIFNRDTVKKKVHNLRHGPAPRPSEEETWGALLQKKFLQRR